MNLNKLNLTEIELFIKMLYGVWSSLQPDHETNKSPHRMQVSPPARNDDRSPIWNIWRPHIFSLQRIRTKDFPYIKEKIDCRSESTTHLSSLNWPNSFFVASRLIAEVNEFFKKYGSKLTRVAMIWLRVKVNRTRLRRAARFARNEIKYQKSRESGLFQYNLYARTIACLSFIPLYKQKFYKCYSLSSS